MKASVIPEDSSCCGRCVVLQETACTARIKAALGLRRRFNVFALAIRKGLTAEDLKATIFAYPTGASDIGYMV